MRRILTHVLLSLALIFQGMGAACAYGSMPVGMGSLGQAADQGMAAMAMPCSEMAADAGSIDNHMAAQDCMQLCSMPAELPVMMLSVPPLLLRDTLALPTIVSLVQHTQVPPTPPPIA
jgi:hypothetical protein